jgi:hypothetical protein
MEREIWCFPQSESIALSVDDWEVLSDWLLPTFFTARLMAYYRALNVFRADIQGLQNFESVMFLRQQQLPQQQRIMHTEHIYPHVLRLGEFPYRN